ncbi:redoxin domain-containing protein [Tundrisphaera sp. TA3]|uniref:redoxin domain-containing protein n=1 Tax=Tundrisphaera sp. TA3 TaxID=3435775 RepID=UPI003EBE10F3
MPMRRACFALLIAALAPALVPGMALADPPGLKTLAIGSPAPDFSLPGVDGKTYSLKDFASAKVLVVYFTCNHCPTAQAYEARVAKLVEDYKDKGVALMAICPNDATAVRLDELGYTDLDDTFESMKIRARDAHYNYPYVYDGETQKASFEYGALATPHVFIFDAERKLRYNGRFDDQEVKPVKSHEAIDAIDALLAGKPVPVEKTRVRGCSTKWADKRDAAKESLAKWDAEPVTLETIDEAGAAALVKNDTKGLLVLNLWATWCGPCIQELPALVEIQRMYRGRGLRVATLSLDDPAKKDDALKVLTDNHVSGLNRIVQVADRDKFADIVDKEWPGPVPHTLVIAPGGEVIYRKTGALDPLELKRAIVGKIGRTY